MMWSNIRHENMATNPPLDGYRLGHLSAKEVKKSVLRH